MLIDSHCHLDRVDLSPYDGSFAQMMHQTQMAGVDHMLCVSISLELYSAMRNQVTNYPQVSISVGIHPNEPLDQTTDWAQIHDQLITLAQDPQNVAIGETGLDYYRSSEELLLQQQQRFRTHIQAARHCKKPLIIHSRHAPQDTIRILREEQAATVGGVLHCFSEDWDTAKAALDLGFYISFSGIVTFPKADNLRAVAKLIPIDRILIETDCPYLAPVPHRGKSNEPKFITAIANRIADIRGMPYHEFVTTTGENFCKLFNRKLINTTAEIHK